LIDQSLTMIALDMGATAILNCQSQAGIQMKPPSCIPSEILEIVRTSRPTDLPVTTHLHFGKSDYTCRIYLVESVTGLMGYPVMAVQLEKVSSVDIISSTNSAVAAIAARYHLTEREQQAFVGISMGLSSKELAERMKISPNTVKVFLRLIMIKMGVSTRGGIVARILEYRTTGEERHKAAGNGAF